MDKKYNILLLTNRDSDNIGDQVIEASDIGLIKAVMKNLNIPESDYKINSRAAGIISLKYLETRNPELLQTAENAIEKCDIVVFGGAPLFNYLYQVFYERTAVTLEIAQKYNKPVIFSAIGVESYHEDNAKCQRLKKTLNFDVVKQITTRDNFEALQKYRQEGNDKLKLGKVSDPAVFCSNVFEPFKTKKKNKKKKVGVFILRANGFKDNGVDFSREDAGELWESLAQRLEERGYDYDLITSGHFGDEAFLERLFRKHNISLNKCVFNMNTPEQLISKISSYDAVISCRLHPSIISFSLDVPSIGIVWNNKVKGFYESVGYEDRIVETDNISADLLIDKVDKIIEEGVKKDNDFLITVYNYLFDGIKDVIKPDEDIAPYTFEELAENIPTYKETTPAQMNEKIQTKFRRVYKKYNDLFEKNVELKKEIAANKKLIKKQKAQIKKNKEELKKTNLLLDKTLYRRIRSFLGRIKRKLIKIIKK